MQNSLKKMPTPEEFINNQVKNDIEKQTNKFNKQVEDYKEIAGFNKPAEDMFVEYYEKFVNLKIEDVPLGKQTLYKEMLPKFKLLLEPFYQELKDERQSSENAS